MTRKEIIEAVTGTIVASEYDCKNEYTMNDEEILHVIQETLREYYRSGVRSSKKLDVLHLFINCLIRHKMKKKIAPDMCKFIKIDSQPVRETKVEGLMYHKDVDVTVTYKSNHVGIVSVKFVMSNYAQNANNYFENLIGECVNLKTMPRPRVFWYSLFSFDNIPYYNKRNEITKFEKLLTQKYKQLYDASLRYPV